ncbi:MAG: (2Fe-2S)-binding protein [Methanospirillaceae archaeon]|nr:(2Fe-2S)-binding protein [Methanospirillaceae archaeon]
MDTTGHTVTITINKNQYQAVEGEILLEVARREKIDIPHLCYESSLSPYGACRLCMVEVVTCGKTEMTTACTVRVHRGLEILTDTPDVIRHRKILLELYLAEAPHSDVIKAMAIRYGVTKTRFLKKIVTGDPLLGRCVLCGLCVRVCNEIMGAGAIGFVNRGPYTIVSTPFLEENPACMGCGTCAAVCPTHAIGIEDTGEKRIMRSWSGTPVEMIRCAGCGGYIGPKPVMEYARSRIDPVMAEELQELCPACRRKQVTR